MELVNPTGLIQFAWREKIESRRRKLHDIIRDTMGPETEDTKTEAVTEERYVLCLGDDSTTD